MTHTQQIAGLKRLVVAGVIAGMVAGFVLALIITAEPMWMNEVHQCL